MVIEIIILLLLLYLCMGGTIGIHNKKDILLDRIRNEMFQLSIYINNSIPFEIIESQHGSYIENKKVIKLQLVDINNNKLYDHDTLTIVAIHELSHVLCKDTDHTKEFYDIENKLRKYAHYHKICPLHSQVDSSYPCLHST